MSCNVFSDLLYSKKILVFFSSVFFLFSFTVGGSEYLLNKQTVNNKVVLLAQTSGVEVGFSDQSLPTLDQQSFQIKGVILEFHNWPNEEQQIDIINFLKRVGLEKKVKIHRFKVWVFEWGHWVAIEEANRVCKNLSSFSFLKNCEPDYLVESSYSDEDQEVVPADQGLEFLDRDSEEEENLRTCNAVSTNFNLSKGNLSDYWAQEMIGADLLKKELEGVDPVTKRLVEVFDVPPTHDVGVRNLVSDEGPHSVLPELEDQIGITHTQTNSKALIAANELLDRVEEECASHLLSSVNQGSPPPGGTTNPGGGGSDPGASQQQGSSQQVGGSIVSQQEIVTHGENEYIILRNWANNRHYELGNVISRFKGDIEYIDNPYIDELREAGESWSSTVHAVPNTEENREKLEQFMQHRGTTVHNRTLTVMWKAGTNWEEEWQSPIEGGGPSPYHDLVADYEVDRDHEESAPIFYRREYRYIFRPPVLDISLGGTSSTKYFNWLSPIVLAPGNKLKVWGTRVVGDGPLVINGVSVTLTEVSGTISDVSGSSKKHGRFEAVLSEEDYNQILTGRISQSVDVNNNQGSTSSESGNTGSKTVHNPNEDTRQNTDRNAHESSGTNTNEYTGTDRNIASQEQERVTYNETEYIMLRGWANNRQLKISSVLFFLNIESIKILQIKNPHIAALRAAGKSWSPTVYAIPNTEENREKLKKFLKEQERAADRRSQ